MHVSRVYWKPRQSMTCSRNSGTPTTPPNGDIYPYLRYHITPTKKLVRIMYSHTHSYFPVRTLMPQQGNIWGVLCRMKRYEKSTISCAGVRVLTFYIGDSLFCLVVFLLNIHLCSRWAGYLIRIKIIYQICICILLRPIIGYDPKYWSKWDRVIIFLKIVNQPLKQSHKQ